MFKVKTNKHSEQTQSNALLKKNNTSTKNAPYASLGWSGTPYDGLYGREAPPERGTSFRLQVYEKVGISLSVKAYEIKGWEI